MIHHSCDRCRRMIDPDREVRYTVDIEVQAAVDSLPTCQDVVDNEALLELHELLESMDEVDEAVIESLEDRRLRFDLCASCYRRFIGDPLGMEKSSHLGFSHN